MKLTLPQRDGQETLYFDFDTVQTLLWVTEGCVCGHIKLFMREEHMQIESQHHTL
jgi:hypothetical protein